ncbi:L-threonylcarbamoyladenylate synthase [Algicola sagamiensis]|uniref:L-threonylcarbamoyladenylate synthase n=1 Tax=Algicola sagamiensis TaxID=163869 RepID=UPI0003647D64|nr:L-threonylcarbamoyladenylate synthase [Algicola sagamiensis]
MVEQETLLEALQQGGVIAYPTEAVFGLGCDPDNEKAVKSLLEIKKRPIEKGLILIAENYSQLLPYIDDKAIPMDRRTQIVSSWPGHVTWILPSHPTTPGWLTGNRPTIACRVTAHPVVREICQHFGKPIVSTSANLSGEPEIKDPVELERIFQPLVSHIVKGPLGSAQQPSQIFDALTGKKYR